MGDSEENLDTFSADETEEKEDTQTEKKTTKKASPRKKKLSTKKAKTEVKKTVKKTDPVDTFLEDNGHLSLSQMIVNFARLHNAPRLLSSDVGTVSPSKNPRTILKHIYAKRQR